MTEIEQMIDGSLDGDAVIEADGRERAVVRPGQNERLAALLKQRQQCSIVLPAHQDEAVDALPDHGADGRKLGLIVEPGDAQKQRIAVFGNLGLQSLDRGRKIGVP